MAQLLARALGGRPYLSSSSAKTAARRGKYLKENISVLCEITDNLRQSLISNESDFIAVLNGFWPSSGRKTVSRAGQVEI